MFYGAPVYMAAGLFRGLGDIQTFFTTYNLSLDTDTDYKKILQKNEKYEMFVFWT